MKDAIGRRRKAVPVIERALLLDRVAVLGPRRVVERRDVGFERRGDLGQEEVVHHDMRERLRCAKPARSPAQSISFRIMRGLTRAAIVISADVRRLRPPRGARGARRPVHFPAALRGAEEPRLGRVCADLGCESLARARFRRCVGHLGHAHRAVDRFGLRRRAFRRRTSEANGARPWMCCATGSPSGC